MYGGGGVGWRRRRRRCMDGDCSGACGSGSVR